MSGAALLRSASIFILLVAAPVRPARGQVSDTAKDSLRASVSLYHSIAPFTVVPDIDGAEEDLWRLAQLRGASTARSLLRTPSSMMAPLGESAPAMPWTGAKWSLVFPRVQYTHNSAVPFSMDDGAMWAGKGANAEISGGVRLEWNRVQIVLAPQLIHEQNLALPFYDNLHSGLPYTLPAYRSPYSTIWNIFPY